MPWLIGAGIHSDWDSEIPLETESYRDPDGCAMTSAQLFPYTRGSDEREFFYTLFNWGRRFTYITKPDIVLSARLGESNNVCDRFKRLLEDLEPGKHRFAQIDLRMADKVTAWPEPYWNWLCDNYIDAIIPDIGDGDLRRSRGLFWRQQVRYFERYLPRSQKRFGILYNAPSLFGGEFQPVLNEGAIEGVHAWAENGFRFRDTSDYRFLSDRLVEHMTEQGITSGFRLGAISISDLPTNRERN